MTKKWFFWINSVLGVLIATFLLATLLFYVQPAEIEMSTPSSTKNPLPKNSFAFSKESYDLLGKTILDLRFAPLTIQPPDLRRHLVYYGKNGRPDAKSESPVLHFAFTGTKTLTSTPAEEKLYVVYDKKQPNTPYTFSPNNEEKALWIEASPQNNNEAIVRVRMKGENGEILGESDPSAKFVVQEKEYARFSGAQWELGSFRVDGSLLGRQKARWFGEDRFFEQHGGKEFAEFQQKQRIDFNGDSETYSVFVGLGDTLIWQDNKWKSVLPGEDSVKYPLMVVKKIDERVLNFELWDVAGKGKIGLNLIRSTDMLSPQIIQQGFKFVGARTRSRFLFEIQGERVSLSPHDWLLATSNGWIKLTTHEEIDAYVERKTVGLLFIFDKVTRKEDGVFLTGTLFSPMRTEMQEVDLPIQQGGGTAKTSNPEANEDQDEEIEHEEIENDDDQDEDEEILIPPSEDQKGIRNKKKLKKR